VHIDVLLQLSLVFAPILGIYPLGTHILNLTVATGLIVGEHQKSIRITAGVQVVGGGQVLDDPSGGHHSRIMSVQKGTLRHLLDHPEDLALADVLPALEEVHCRGVFLWGLQALGDLRPLGVHQDAVDLLLVGSQPDAAPQGCRPLRFHNLLP